MEYDSMEPPGLHSIRSAAFRLGLNYPAFRKHCDKGHIPTIRLGSKRYVPEPVVRALETGEGALELLGARSASISR